tara:strand:+ start:126 stop:548 length:423 start_codon:yes stop_codon:yes gene_type:complete
MTLDHTIRGAYIDTLLDGGFTRLLDGTTNPTEGYIIGGVTEPSTMLFGGFISSAYADVSEHYAKFKQLWEKYDVLLDEHKDTYRMHKFTAGLGIGTWIHDGQIYFDLVQHLYNLEIATREAKKRGEIAIYDCKNQKDLLL